MRNAEKDRVVASGKLKKSFLACLSLVLSLGLMPGIALAEEKYPDVDQPVIAPSMPSGDTEVNVGNVTVETGETGKDVAALAHSDGNPNVELNIHGSVVVGGTDTGTSNAIFIDSNSSDSTGSIVTVNVDNDVITDVTSDNKPLGDRRKYAIGIDANADGPNSQAVVNVGGSVETLIHTSANDHTMATGIDQSATSDTPGQQVSSSVNITGNVKAMAADQDGEAIGIGLLTIGSGSCAATVMGGVVAQGGEGGATGVSIDMVSPDPKTTQTTVTIGQSGITANANSDATGIDIYNPGGTVTIRVGGDVTITTEGSNSEAIGMNLEGDAGTTDVFVDGTITAKTAGVLNRTDGGQVEVTVWKIDSDLVAAKLDERLVCIDDETTRKAINYIIRLEQPKEGNILKLVGASVKEVAWGEQTTSYDIAHMGQKVYLDIDKGWAIINAFSDTGKSVKLEQDPDGRWYVIVPDGGGVYLSAQVAQTFPLTFDLGGGSVGDVTGTLVMDAIYGSTVTLPTPVREGYTFLYWEGSRYDAGADYTALGAHVFKAIWQKNEPSPTKPTYTSSTVTTAAASPVNIAQTTPNTGDSADGPITVTLVAAASLAVALFAYKKWARRDPADTAM